MPLVHAKCTNCGGSLSVDSEKDAAVCTHCQSPFIVEKAINNYNVANAQISAQVVHVYNSNLSDFVIRGGVLEEYNGTSREVVIPDSVTVIGEKAFMGSKITSVVIPPSVAEIKGLVLGVSSEHGFNGHGAFADCVDLREVMFSEGLTRISLHSFKNCLSLNSVSLPASLTEIYQGAFNGCSALESVTFHSAVKFYQTVLKDDKWSFPPLSSDVVEYDHKSWVRRDCFASCPKLTDVYMCDETRNELESFVQEFRKIHPYQERGKTLDEFYLSYADHSKWEDSLKKRMGDLSLPFMHTPYMQKFLEPIIQSQLAHLENVKKEWVSQGLCQYCGGTIGFIGKCKECKRKQ